MILGNLFKNEKSNNIYFHAVRNKNAKTAIVFIHGLVGSRRFWDKAYHSLSKNYSLYFIDLLGFGYSAKPSVDYTLEIHIKALRKFIREEVREKSIVLIGHSVGAIISLAYANKYPKGIKKLYLLALPYYYSEKEARKTVKKNTVPSYFAIDSLLTKISCMTICYLGGPVTRKYIHLLIRDWPKEVISDAFLHTYQSYISTLENVLYKQRIINLLSNSLKKRIVLIHGQTDKIVPVDHVKEFAKKYGLKLIILDNKGHKFPISAKEQLVNIINEGINL